MGHSGRADVQISIQSTGGILTKTKLILNFILFPGCRHLENFLCPGAGRESLHHWDLRRTKPPAMKSAMTLPGKHSDITEHAEAVRGMTCGCGSGVREGREQKRNDREGENGVGWSQ